MLFSLRVPLLLFVLAILSVGINSCKKEDGDSNDNNTSIVFNSALSYGSVIDQEGNSYRTIKIGNQTWMAENLRTTIYNDGSSIARILVDSAAYLLPKGAYDNYNKTNNSDTIRTVGRHYNWYAVNSGKLAPAGWHVASKAEWDTLVANLGGLSVAGGKLKETGFTHWSSPNTGATNESGFTALPAGRFYIVSKSFTHYTFGAWYWSSTSYSADEATYYGLNHTDNSVYKSHAQLFEGYSVRCVKD